MRSGNRRLYNGHEWRTHPAHRGPKIAQALEVFSSALEFVVHQPTTFSACGLPLRLQRPAPVTTRSEAEADHEDPRHRTDDAEPDQ